MWYHAIVEVNNSKRYPTNLTRDELVRQILVPIVSKHVVAAGPRGRKTLLNLGAVSRGLYRIRVRTGHKQR